MHRGLRIFSVLTVLVSYIMLTIGAIVTKTNSGKGCGNSWPFCHGQLIPSSFPMETVIEYSHRIVSGIAGLMIVILAIWAWKAFPESKRVKWFGFMSVFFVIFQGALGALTVVFEGVFARKAALSLHFGFSLISFAFVALLMVHLFQLNKGKSPEQITEQRKRDNPISKRLQYGIWGLAAWTYVVVYTGALVRHMSATMSCGFSFPGCGGVIFPSFDSPAGIHMLHRYASASLWILTAVLLWVVYRYYREREDLHKGAWWSLILITLQAVSGIWTVLSGGQLLIVLVHTSIISAYFSVLCYLCLQVGWPKKKQSTQLDKETPVLQP